MLPSAMITHLVVAVIVSSITPNSGPTSGGTVVTIRGEELNPNIQCILPCPPVVTFGERSVEATERGNRELVVVTPEHVPGAVDVKIAAPGREEVVVRNGFTFYERHEQGYEKVLLPILLSGTASGAGGSQWQTEFRLRNVGDTPLRVAPYVCEPAPCPPVFPSTYVLLPGASLPKAARFSTTRGNPSQMLYVSEPATVAAGLRVSDISRSAWNAGTDVPVIREHELLTAATQLVNVPLDATRSRILLRVYDVDQSSAEFSVNFYRDDDDAAEPVYRTSVTATTPQQPPFRTEAAYGELDITRLLHLRLAWPSTARIEVIPRTRGSRYWAFVSLTNNETQLVTLVTPQ